MLYDSGANTYLYDGEMAEAGSFRVINPTCTLISVAGEEAGPTRPMVVIAASSALTRMVSMRLKPRAWSQSPLFI
jgi:hypothetical protein